jgi:toxin FitB
VIYLLDTSVVIDALNDRRGRAGLLEELLLQDHSLGCCSVNVTEVFAGMRPTEQARTEELLNSLDYYEVTWAVAKHAGLLKRDWARKGITLSVSDVTIAAVALANSLVLITDNVKHYPMRDLQLYRLP